MAVTSGVVHAPSKPVGAIEVHSIDWIPEHERHGKLWHQPIFWFQGDFQIVTVGIGFVGPSVGLSIFWTFLAGLIGISIGTVFMAFHASQGPRMGLPQMIQSRAQFGYRGVVVPLVAVLLTYLILNIIGQDTIAEGMTSVYGVNGTLSAILLAVIAAALAFFGHDWLHRAFQLMLYVTVPLMAAISVAMIIGDAGPVVASHAHYGFNLTGFMVMLGVAVAYNITYAVYVSDYSRYLPSRTSSRGVIASVFIGAAASPIWLIPFGAWLAVKLGSTGPLAGLTLAGNNLAPHFGSITGGFAVAALVAITGMNAYGASLTLLTGVDSLRKIRPTRTARAVTIALGALTWCVVGLALGGSAENALNTGLTLLLYLVVPWTAANLLDFFLARKGHYAITHLFALDGIYSRWGWRGLTAYFAGIAAQVPFMVLGTPINFTGPVAKSISGIDVSWAVGLAVTLVVYWVVSRSINVAAEAPAIAESERELAAAYAPGAAYGQELVR